MSVIPMRCESRRAGFGAAGREQTTAPRSALGTSTQSPPTPKLAKRQSTFLNETWLLLRPEIRRRPHRSVSNGPHGKEPRKTKFRSAPRRCSAYNFAASSRRLAQNAQNSPTRTPCLGPGVGDATPEPRAVVIGLSFAAAKAGGRNRRIAVAGAECGSCHKKISVNTNSKED